MDNWQGERIRAKSVWTPDGYFKRNKAGVFDPPLPDYCKDLDTPEKESWMFEEREKWPVNMFAGIGSGFNPKNWEPDVDFDYCPDDWGGNI